MTTALVTGAAGFVGSELSRALLDSGVDRVVGIDRLSDYYDPLIKRKRVESIHHEAFEFVEADLNLTDLDDIVEGVDVVFHQAGQPGVRPSWGESFQIYIDDNIRATQRLLESIVRTGNRAKLIYASSSSVYGDAVAYPVRELDPTRPRSPYGVTKLAAEHLVSLYSANHGLNGVSLRYFTVYGPGQRPDMAFTRMCTAIARGESIDIYGTGEQIRDFTYVTDIVNANVLAMTADTAPGLVVNVAGGSSVSLNSCISILEELSGRPVNRRFYPQALGDVFRTGGATDLASDILGWEPKIDIQEGLRKHFEWAVAGGFAGEGAARIDGSS